MVVLVRETKKTAARSNSLNYQWVLSGTVVDILVARAWQVSPGSIIQWTVFANKSCESFPLFRHSIVWRPSLLPILSLIPPSLTSNGRPNCQYLPLWTGGGGSRARTGKGSFERLFARSGDVESDCSLSDFALSSNARFSVVYRWK